jgi:LysR family glycine cleavage system transcriptional activator
LGGSREIHVASCIHAIEAAIAGLGVALSHTPFVWDALKTEKLVAIEPALQAEEGRYYVVSPQAQAQTVNIAAFWHWLLAQVAEDAQI